MDVEQCRTGPGVVVTVPRVFMQEGESRCGCLPPALPLPPSQDAGWKLMIDSEGPCTRLVGLKPQWAETEDIRDPQGPGSGTEWVRARKFEPQVRGVTGQARPEDN